MLYEAPGGIVGFTDEGFPLILSEHTCPHWLPGALPTLNAHTCWFCRWADFRKTDEIGLKQSICRCTENRVSTLRGNENENQKIGGNIL